MRRSGLATLWLAASVTPMLKPSARYTCGSADQAFAGSALTVSAGSRKRTLSEILNVGSSVISRSAAVPVAGDGALAVDAGRDVHATAPKAVITRRAETRFISVRRLPRTRPHQPEWSIRARVP